MADGVTVEKKRHCAGAPRAQKVTQQHVSPKSSVFTPHAQMLILYLQHDKLHKYSRYRPLTVSKINIHCISIFTAEMCLTQSVNHNIYTQCVSSNKKCVTNCLTHILCKFLTHNF